jgi:hypothetical protein
MDRLPYVAGATVYELRDMGVEPSNPEQNFGLLHANLAPRPSYTAFRTAMRTGIP